MRETRLEAIRLAIAAGADPEALVPVAEAILAFVEEDQASPSTCSDTSRR